MRIEGGIHVVILAGESGRDPSREKLERFRARLAMLSGLAMRSPRSNQRAVRLDRLPIPLGIRSRIFLPK